MRINVEELKQLFIGIKHNDNISFEKLYNKYNKLVYGIAFSILKNEQESEEIVQNAFLKIYQLDKNKLPTSNEASWLYSMVKNETLILLRKKKVEINIDKIYNLKCEDTNIEKIIDKECYKKLISKLSDDEKEIVSLKIIGNFSFNEIGKILDKSSSTIKWKYYKSINTIKFSIANLFMFIFTFIIGKFVEVIENKKITKTTIKNNNNIGKEDNTDIEINTDITDVYIKAENAENIIDFENENTINETYTLAENNSNIEILQVFKLGFTTFSYVFFTFFLISIIIFIKYQLKLRKKASK